jgi:hypothetical protein
VNLYEDENAYYKKSAFRKTPIPAERNHWGDTLSTMEEANYYELATGTKGRSGGQFDIWQAVFSTNPLFSMIDHI